MSFIRQSKTDSKSLPKPLHTGFSMKVLSKKDLAGMIFIVCSFCKALDVLWQALTAVEFIYTVITKDQYKHGIKYLGS